MISVKEVFPTMQGEGSRTGVPCVFIRLTGCNLWSGTLAMRDHGSGACAAWCDTDFVGGNRMAPEQVVESTLQHMAGWPVMSVVISGGEPCLQLRRPAGETLVCLLQEAGVHVAVETNGTIKADVLSQIDHVTVSPKLLRAKSLDPLAHVVVREGTDLKVVLPQWDDTSLQAMSDWDFEHRYVQPLDLGLSPAKAGQQALKRAAQLGWRVSVQTHKLLEIP